MHRLALASASLALVFASSLAQADDPSDRSAAIATGAPAKEKRETALCTRGPGCIATQPPSGVFGVRGSELSVDGVAGDDRTFGATFGGRSYDYGTEAPVTYRATTRWAIGGGSGGFEGALGASVAGGMRADVDENAGIVLRVGAEGYLMGNQAFYASFLELPQVQLGFQQLELDDVVEVGAKGGAVLAGKFDPGNAGAERRLGSAFEWGGYVSLHFPIARLDFSATRIEARKTGSGRPVDIVEGDLCVGRLFVICGDGRLQRGDVDLDAQRFVGATTLYAGITLGVAFGR